MICCDSSQQPNEKEETFYHHLMMDKKNCAKWEVNSFGGMSEEVCEPLSQSLGGLNWRANKTETQ